MRRREPGNDSLTRSLLGRLDVVEAVRARVREAAAGRPGVVVLSGVPAIGRSSLLAQVCDEVSDEAEVRVVTCAGGPAFTAARELLEPPRDLLTAPMDDYSRLSALSALVAGLAAQQPLVLALDDAHRCDAETARWLGFLARRSAGQRICVVLTYPVPVCPQVEMLFSELTGVLDTIEIPLRPLGEQDVRELVAQGFGEAPHDDFVRACLEVSAGRPGIARRWIDLFVERGARPDTTAAGQLLEEGITTSSDGFLSQMARQPEPVRRYATAAAVVGSTDAAAVGALFELSAVAALSAKTVLRTNGLLTEDGRFTTPELRERVLAELGEGELTALRTKAARMMRDEGAPHVDVAELVMALPALTEVWMFCALREAAQDTAVSPDVAIGYLRRVLAAVPAHVDTRLELAGLLTGTDPSAALALYVEVLRDVPDVETRASIVVKYGLVALQARRSREAFPMLLDVLRALPPADVTLRRLVEETLLVTGYHDMSTVRRTIAFAREITPPANPRAQENARLVHQLARTEMLVGRSVEKVRELTRLAMPQSYGPHDWWDLFPVAALHVCGDTVEATTLVDRLVEAAEARGDGMSLTLALTARAAMKVDCGELAEAEEDAEKALVAMLPGARPSRDFWTRVVLASVAVRRDENDRAEQLFFKLGTPHDPLEHGWALTTRARWLRNCDDHEGALEVLLRCGREFDEMGVGNPVIVPWWVEAASLLVVGGRHGEALELAERFRPEETGWDTPRARGYALLVEGMATRSVESLEQAVSEFAVAGARLHECQALTELGTALLDAGHDKAARKHLREAVGLAVRCGDICIANAARAALVEAGGRMGELSETPLDALTGAERRVAALAAEGLSNREIADALFITVRTVESHLSNAYRKLGVTTRADLAAQLR